MRDKTALKNMRVKARGKKPRYVQAVLRLGHSGVLCTPLMRSIKADVSSSLHQLKNANAARLRNMHRHSKR